MRRPLWLLAVAVAVLAAAGRAPALAGGSELIVNGLLAEGADGTPLGWRYQSYFPDSDAEKYSWEVDPAGIGTLKIVHTQMSDSQWIQDFAVSPRTWYHVSGWIRTEMVGPPAAIGAHLSIAENGYSSDDVRGTAGWRQVGFWMKTAKDQKSLELECRLGSFSAASLGTTYFTAISVSEGAPPPSSDHVYGGDVWDAPTQRRVLIWLLAVIAAYGAALLFWRLAAPVSGRIPR